MRHRASLFRLKLQTPPQHSPCFASSKPHQHSIITCRFYGGGEAEKSLSKMNIRCKYFFNILIIKKLSFPKVMLLELETFTSTRLPAFNWLSADGLSAERRRTWCALLCSNNAESKGRSLHGAQPTESYYDYPISGSGKLFHLRDPDQHRSKSFRIHL